MSCFSRRKATIFIEHTKIRVFCVLICLVSVYSTRFSTIKCYVLNCERGKGVEAVYWPLARRLYSHYFSLSAASIANGARHTKDSQERALGSKVPTAERMKASLPCSKNSTDSLSNIRPQNIDRCTTLPSINKPNYKEKDWIFAMFLLLVHRRRKRVFWPTSPSITTALWTFRLRASADTAKVRRTPTFGEDIWQVSPPLTVGSPSYRALFPSLSSPTSCEVDHGGTLRYLVKARSHLAVAVISCSC